MRTQHSTYLMRNTTLYIYISLFKSKKHFIIVVFTCIAIEYMPKENYCRINDCIEDLNPNFTQRDKY